MSEICFGYGLQIAPYQPLADSELLLIAHCLPIDTGGIEIAKLQAVNLQNFSHA